MTFPADCSLVRARTRLAKVLLDDGGERHQLAQRDMATLGDIGWEMVHASLRSLQNEGAIRIERHRIIINKELLKKVTGAVHQP
jgi:hypothetical protein